MASTAISPFESQTTPFVGQGDLVIFNATTIGDATTLSNFEGAKSLGQIVQDSSNWEGEDASSEEIKDEQGNIITAKPIAGTNGFSFDIASTSSLMLQKFMKAVALDATAIGSASAAWIANAATAAGFGVDIPVVELPIMWVNDTKDRCLFFPKAKITSNFSYSDGLFRIHATCIAEQVNTTHLKTVMVIDGAATYA